MSRRKIFGRNVRRLRRAQDLSQEALGFACDLHRTYIGAVERGECNIALGNMERIAAGLGVDLLELLRLPSDAIGPKAGAMIGGDEAQAAGEACMIAQSLMDAAVQAERQGLPGIAARMRQAAWCIERLVELLARRAN